MSGDTKVIAASKEVADISNKILSDLSFSLRDNSFAALRPTSNEVTPQNSASIRIPIKVIPSKEVSNETSHEKAIVYPVPSTSYNPNRCPPDLVQASKHGLAHGVRRFNPANWLGEVCESTGVPIIFKKIGLWCSLNDLYFLGPVIPMYFLLLKQLVFAAFLLSWIPIAIIISSGGQYSWNYKESMKTFFNDEYQVMTFTLCTLGAVIVGFIVMYLFRRNQKKTKLACKKGVITPADYTVMARNLGTLYTEQEIKTFFGGYIIHGYNLDACKATLTFDIKQFTDKIRTLKSLIVAKDEAEEADNTVRNIQEQINATSNFLIQKNSFLVAGKGLEKNGLCFVTFSTKQEAKSIRRKFEISWPERTLIWILEKFTDEFPEYFFKGNYMKVERAPELNEILWENLNCYASNKRITLLNICVPIITIAISFIAMLFIKKSDMNGNEYLLGLAVAIFNEILSFIVYFLSCYERFRTTTDWNISIGQRKAFAQFINTSVPIIILDIFVYPFAEIADFSFDIFIICIITSFAPILLRAINLPYLKKRMQRRMINHQVKTNSNSFGVTQEEANYAYEDAEYNVPSLYANTIKTLLVGCLFFSISPGVLGIAFISYILSYIVDKYNLLRKSLMPSSLRSEISEAMFEYLDFAIFLLALGTILLIEIIDNNASSHTLCETLSIAGIIFSLIYALLPHKRYSRMCFSNKKKSDWTNLLFYQQAMEYFSNDYHTSNPISKQTLPPRESQELFKNLSSQYKALPDFSETPEVLVLFNHIIKRPNLSEVFYQGLDGLKNPYYTFPQNYSYGAFYYGSLFAVSKENMPIKVPLIGNLSPKNRHDELEIKRKTVIRSQEMVPSSIGSSEGKEKLPFGENSGSGKVNSVMKDIMLFPSFSGKSPYALKVTNPASRKDNYGASSSFDEIKEINENQDSQTNVQTTSVHESSEFIDGISPITNAWISIDNQKAKESLRP